jgi:hypothetical protein
MATPTTLPATFVAGNILTAAQMNNLRGAFRVLQVVYADYALQVVTASSTYIDTGLTGTITPQSASSKILVCVSQNGIHKSSNDTSVSVKLVRGASDILFFGSELGLNASATQSNIGSASAMMIDSPATTSATTYKTQFKSDAGLNFGVVQRNSITSTLILMEISA